jgi:hypothetical protein
VSSCDCGNTPTSTTEVWERHDERSVYRLPAKEMISKVKKSMNYSKELINNVQKWPVKYSKEFANKPKVK